MKIKKGEVLWADMGSVVESNDPMNCRVKLKECGLKEYEDLNLVPDDEQPAVKRMKQSTSITSSPAASASKKKKASEEESETSTCKVQTFHFEENSD